MRKGVNGEGVYEERIDEFELCFRRKNCHTRVKQAHVKTDNMRLQRDTLPITKPDRVILNIVQIYGFTLIVIFTLVLHINHNGIYLNLQSTYLHNFRFFFTFTSVPCLYVESMPFQFVLEGILSYLIFVRLPGGTRAAVAQSVERSTHCKEVEGSIPALAASSLLVGSVSL